MQFSKLITINDRTRRYVLLEGVLYVVRISEVGNWVCDLTHLTRGPYFNFKWLSAWHDEQWAHEIQRFATAADVEENKAQILEALAKI